MIAEVLAQLRAAKQEAERANQVLTNGDFLEGLVPEEELLRAKARYQRALDALREAEETLKEQESLAKSCVREAALSSHANTGNKRYAEHGVRASVSLRKAYDPLRAEDLARQAGLLDEMVQSGAFKITVDKSKLTDEMRKCIEDAQYTSSSVVTVRGLYDQSESGDK